MEFAVLYLILILLITYNVYRYTEHESLKTQMMLLLDYKKDIESQLNLLNTDIEQMTRLQTQRNQQQYSDISEILNQAFTPSVYPNPNVGTRHVPNFIVQTPPTPMSSPVPPQVQPIVPEVPEIPLETPPPPPQLETPTPVPIKVQGKISFNKLSGA